MNRDMHMMLKPKTFPTGTGIGTGKKILKQAKTDRTERK